MSIKVACIINNKVIGVMAVLVQRYRLVAKRSMVNQAENWSKSHLKVKGCQMNILGWIITWFQIMNKLKPSIILVQEVQRM